jgi:hypothetical protein
MPFLKVALLVAAFVGLFELRASFVKTMMALTHTERSSGDAGSTSGAPSVSNVQVVEKTSLAKEIIENIPNNQANVKQDHKKPADVATDAKPSQTPLEVWMSCPRVFLFLACTSVQ